jgi:hypothetical protein
LIHAISSFGIRHSTCGNAGSANRAGALLVSPRRPQGLKLVNCRGRSKSCSFTVAMTA